MALLLVLLWGRLLVQEVVVAAYLVLVVVTVVLVRGVRAEPGSWLSRRAAGRGLVGLMGAVCVALLATPPTTSAGRSRPRSSSSAPAPERGARLTDALAQRRQAGQAQ